MKSVVSNPTGAVKGPSRREWVAVFGGVCRSGVRRRWSPTGELVGSHAEPQTRGGEREEKGVLYDIGGVEDHVHMYFRWRPDGSISDLMRTVMARSSKWVYETYPNLAACSWQEGYSVFSVSKSQEEAVKKYIAGQAEHHKKEDFKSELLRILRAHGVEFDEKYVFE